MTPEQKVELKRRIDVMQAYLDGLFIDSKLQEDPDKDMYWLKFESESPSWNWARYDYRISPAVPDEEHEATLNDDSKYAGCPKCGASPVVTLAAVWEMNKFHCFDCGASGSVTEMVEAKYED